MKKAARAKSTADAPTGQIVSDAPVALRGVCVFVAEDEPMLLWALEEILDSFGCKVVGSAATVAEALQFIQSNAFDVAILDGQLMDGDIQPAFELLSARGTPVIISSGIDRLAASSRFKNALILQKPYKEEDLVAALLAVMA